MAALHTGIERLIAASGLESTIIRPGMFASNAPGWWSTAIRTGGVIRWPYAAAGTAPSTAATSQPSRRGPCCTTDMPAVLAAWGATIGQPAFVTSTVFDILRSAPRSFRQWVADHAGAFTDA